MNADHAGDAGEAGAIGAAGGTGPVSAPVQTEERLREAMAALAGHVHAAPDAYRTARGQWHRRERRRRLVLGTLIAVVFTLATLAGLWVLNSAPADSPGVFDGDRMPAPAAPPGG
ncbi:hypothetical protein ACH4E8_20505 [Streptomyces sp. NPDC017979]|uniref:hypothetical protein n=1 Tax=Streptomyces sp. NPDC017979 TaxID=3365024 RepID=UPI0037961925